jgi:predicted transcriptional regulator
MSKSIRIRKHAKKRFSDRIGIVLDQNTETKIIKIIEGQNRAGHLKKLYPTTFKNDFEYSNAIFVEKQSSRVDVWDIKINDRWERIVYDKYRKQIVTVIPKEPDGTYSTGKHDHLNNLFNKISEERI